MDDNHKTHEQNMKSLYHLLNSHMISRLIYSVSKVGIPDILKDGC